MTGAIQTVYKGYLFRSRLEARWAVFFDALGIEWKYEDQGYEVGEHRYLPDFWLPTMNAWVEVKGDPDGLRVEFERMSAVLGPRSPLPGFVDGTSAVLVLGDVPNVSYGVTVLHPCMVRDAILTRTWAFFAPAKAGGYRLIRDRQQSMSWLLWGKYAFVEPGDAAESTAWDPAPWVLDTPGEFQSVLNAYKAARQARFEHGANGR
jgi:hypothetical protein